MAYEQLEIPEGLDAALPDLISKAISHSESAFGEMQEEMTDFYKGELPGVTQEDKDDGRSDIVSRDVHDAVMATMPDLIRIFTGPENLVEFEPTSPQDEPFVEQVNEVVRYLFEKKNDAFGIIHGSLKDGLIRKFAVASWWHEFVDESYVEEYTLPEDEFTMFMEENGDSVEVVTAKPIKRRNGVHIKAKVRHVKHEHKYIVDLVPPEELIVSPNARDAKGSNGLVGRKQNLHKAALVGMGYDEKVVEDLAGNDPSLETGGMAAARNPDATLDASDVDEDEILYCEVFVRWPHEGRMQLFKVCTGGIGYEIIGCEPVDEVNMALWTPDPEPHTPVGESQAEKVADIQRLKTGVWRGMIDSLAEALVPRTEVVEGQVNIEDAMSTEIGGLVRVRQPNMIRALSTPFVGQQAVPLLDAIDTMREERVGAFRAADGLSSEAMQSSTKMAVAATISGSKAQKELLARIYAWTFLRPIFRGLLKLVVQHQDREMTMQLTGGWVQVDPRSWNADMAATVVNLTQAMMTPEEKAMQLAGIATKQEQIILQLGPINPICTIGHYAETLREMVKVSGRRNIDKYFMRLPTDPTQLHQHMQQFAQFQPPAQPDPTTILAQAQAKNLEEEADRKKLEAIDKADAEERRHTAEMDLQRDRLDQERELALLDMEGKYGVQADQARARIEADVTKNRDNLAAQQQQHQVDLQAQAGESEAERQVRLQEAEQARQHEGQQKDLDRMHSEMGEERQLGFQAEQANKDAALRDQQHQRATAMQEKIAAARAAKPARKSAPKPKGKP